MISIDLHSHTTASDGSLDPIELYHRAQERHVHTLAITDHDTVAAHYFLRDHAPGGDIRLITGIELSTTWSGAEIHIVGLNFSLDHRDLEMVVKAQGESRRKRSHHIAERLAHRLPDWNADQIFQKVLEGAVEQQQNSRHGFILKPDDVQIGRPHFARWLISEARCNDMDAAFRKYLDNSKIGNLKAFWPGMSQGVAWIRALGGTAVLAHPGKYRMTATKLRALIKDFKLAGGHAMEVQGSNHPHSQVEQMARYCREFNLMASQGSDFHNPDYPWVDIGRLPPSLPENLTPIWDIWK
ncbi:PHP domain-containing protein [Endozoicomonas sp. SESOKO1]|uniref:PHP domain-containing protein n=1 Tax=Endozoicomonas sp. SESOKO1 TaxID=2828742 RepID=UPI00214991F5|nr:PHP domain-containing protein [Endozoicomonas sp. SESOKO1]